MTWVWLAMRIKKEKPENDSKYESKSWCEVADGWSKSCWAEFYAFIVTQLTWKPASPPKHKIIKIRSNTNFTSEFFFWNCVLLIWQFSHFKKKSHFPMCVDHCHLLIGIYHYIKRTKCTLLVIGYYHRQILNQISKSFLV